MRISTKQSAVCQLAGAVITQVSMKLAHHFCSNSAHRQTDRQTNGTDYITSPTLSAAVIVIMMMMMITGCVCVCVCRNVEQFGGD